MSINTYYNPNEIAQNGRLVGEIRRGDQGISMQESPGTCFVGILRKAGSAAAILPDLASGLHREIDEVCSRIIKTADDLKSVRHTLDVVVREIMSDNLLSIKAQAVKLSAGQRSDILSFWRAMGPSVADTMQIFEVPIGPLNALPTFEWRDSWRSFSPSPKANRAEIAASGPAQPLAAADLA